MEKQIDHIHFEGNTVSILRLDLPDPVSCGNKSFKLKYNFEEMKKSGQKRLLTFGGAYSNLIAAVASVGKKNGIETTGIIRGQELSPYSNDVLQFANANGMKLHFVSRDDYQKRHDPDYQQLMKERFECDVVLPEGGSNALAVKGCMEILSHETESADIIFCPVGTGATLAGIIASAQPHQTIIGVAVLNGRDYLEHEVHKFLAGKTVEAQWKIDHDHTFGGYAKYNDELKSFVSQMNAQYSIPLDEIYSGKCFYSLIESVKKQQLADSKVLFIHTGGYAFT